MVIANALQPVLFLEQYPKAVIDVFIQVIQADLRWLMLEFL
jgi:ribonuclease PH